MSTLIGWLIIVWDIVFGSYDLLRAMSWAARSDYPLTVFWVAMTMLMAWLAAWQLRHMRRRRGSR